MAIDFLGTMEFEHLRSEEDWIRAFPVLQEFRPKLQLESFLQARAELISHRYHLLSLGFERRILRIAGVTFEPHILRGIEMRVKDLATLSSERGKGLGRVLMEHVKEFARENACSRILLFSQMPNTSAHRFYEQKLNFKRYGIEFSFEL